MALLNQSFLLRGPLPDSTTYRSRYLLSAGNASMVRSACFVEPASSCLLLVCMQLFFFSPLSPPPPGPVLSPLGRDNRRLGPSDPLSVSLCLPTAAYACLRTYHLAVVSGTCYAWRRPLAYLGRYARRAHAMPGLMMGRKKSVAGRPCRARWDFHDHRGGRPQGTARRVWLIGRILNTPARMRPHILRPVVESQNPSRQARPPHTTDRNLPPWPVVKSVCRLSTSPSSNQRPILPFPKPPPADPRARRIQSGQHCRGCRRVLLATNSREPHRQVLIPLQAGLTD